MEISLYKKSFCCISLCTIKRYNTSQFVNLGKDLCMQVCKCSESRAAADLMKAKESPYA